MPRKLPLEQVWVVGYFDFARRGAVCHTEGMPKRISKKRPRDVNSLAHQLVRESTDNGQPELKKSEISRIMAEMGRKGGKKGGKRRLETLTQEQRSTIAFKAARARWDKTKKP